MNYNTNYKFTSSLNKTLISFLTGSISCINPVENPTTNGNVSSFTANELKSWQVGLIPLYIFLSIGLVKSAPFKQIKIKIKILIFVLI